MGKNDMEIRLLKEDEIDVALELAWNVFLRFEASEYTNEGVEEFRKTIFSKEFIQRQNYVGAFDCGNLIGMITTRENKSHISMFFVDERYQGKGVGRKLFNEIYENNINEKITVNSSPYALGIYKHFGFVETDKEKCTNGIRYIPMELKIEKRIKQSKNKLIQDRKKKQKLIADKQRYFDYYDDVKVSSHKIYDW